MTDVDDRLVELDMVQLVELALGNTTRTAFQQRVLEDLCRQLDQDPAARLFVGWEEQAASTWLHMPCDACGRTVSTKSGHVLCLTCRMSEPCNGERMTYLQRRFITRQFPCEATVLPVGICGDHAAAAVYVGGRGPKWAARCTCGFDQACDGTTFAARSASAHIKAVR